MRGSAGRLVEVCGNVCGHGLGMRPAKHGVIAFANDLVVCDDDTSDHWIGFDQTEAARGQFEGPLHKFTFARGKSRHYVADTM